MLDVRRMRVLREVAAKGSFSAAAESLAYTQSAVSQQIATLERETGARLVERGQRGIALTDAGRALVAHTDVILARLADAEAELEAIAGLRGGRVRMVAFPSVGATLMPPAIARFRAAHPAVDLHLNPAEPDDGIGMVRAGDADIAITTANVGESHPDDGIERTTLLDDPMHLIMPVGHRLAGRARIRLADLADEQWILGSSSGTCLDSRIALRACGAAGFEPHLAFQNDDYNAIQGFVAAGVGVSLIPDLALVNVRDDVVVRSLGRRAPVRRIVAATMENSWCSPARAAMLEILVAVGADWASGSRCEQAVAC
jgi:DNA-binding transcriptional LysR family regulator